jgi:hypothetical protein
MQMKAYKLIFIFTFLMVSSGLFAQTAEDALRFSNNTNQTGTARFMSLSGAMGAIGGDLSTVHYNPAGLGIYKSSEYIFAPRYLFNKAQTSYSGANSEARRDNINYGMFGLVSSMPLINRINPDASGWKYVQFGFTLNRVDNYREDIFIQGNTYGGSKVLQWRDEAEGFFPSDLNPFTTTLAWETYLLDTLTGMPTSYIAANPAQGVNQELVSENEGYKNEMSFAMSGNYNDKFFIGASLSFVFLNYYRYTTYRESALSQPADFEFNAFTFREELNTRGNGFNMKIGMIYMITPSFRVSGAFHTPTWFYNMTDLYYTQINSRFLNGESYSFNSPNGRFDYSMNTPLRAMGGLAIIIKKSGFISVDYEYMDYSSSRLNGSGNTFSNENQRISNDFQGTHSLRVGAEWSVSNLFFRGGYGFSTSPVKEDINQFYHDHYSFGLGYRSGPFFMDFAFMQTLNSQNYYMYDANYVNPAWLESRRSYYSLSLGFKF